MTDTVRERFNGWAKVLMAFIPLLVAGLIAWGSQRSDITHLQEESATHASRETQSIQYEAILRELRTINERMSRLEAQR